MILWGRSRSFLSQQCKKQQKYVKAKSEYAPESVRTQRAYTKAKEAVEAQTGSRAVVKIQILVLRRNIRKKTVFRLAPKSLQKYLNEELRHSILRKHLIR